MIVVKFGGSSLADAQRMIAAARIVAAHQRNEPVVCVVSAMAGVTDQLITLANAKIAGSAEWRTLYTNLQAQRHETCAALAMSAATASEERSSTLTHYWEALAADLATLASLTESAARAEAVAVFSAWGERLSVRLFQMALARIGVGGACFEDAPVIVEHDASRHLQQWTASVAATHIWLADPIGNLLRMGKTPILPGYLAMTQDGRYTTLGRNGSDHSAAVIAAALDANAVYLYSDVAGVYQADPHLMPGAKLLPTLSYSEAAAIAARGARVLHPATLSPLAQRHIPLHLRSAFTPDAPGTDIGQTAAFDVGAFIPSHAVAYDRKIGRRDAY